MKNKFLYVYIIRLVLNLARKIETDKLITTDINILLEANIALFRTKNTQSAQTFNRSGSTGI